MLLLSLLVNFVLGREKKQNGIMVLEKMSVQTTHVIIPIRLILADKNECRVNTNGFGHVNISNSCQPKLIRLIN